MERGAPKHQEREASKMEKGVRESGETKRGTKTGNRSVKAGERFVTSVSGFDTLSLSF